ncbi:MAG: ATP-binding cassette domain-containing protein, partial [Candidatus Omnitrophica bacterium]|nr:ATP-binding cassette domain-containing protein [Candidatus Omnitrophota bacterium]
RNKFFGFIFQMFNLLSTVNVIDNTTLPFIYSSEITPEKKKNALEILKKVGLSDRLDHKPNQLSGGQQQRVAIARALITEPALVIADEPTANLDSDNARKIIDLMRKINSLKGTIFLFSTHDQRLLDRVHRQIQLEDGVIVDDKLREKS